VRLLGHWWGQVSRWMPAHLRTSRRYAFLMVTSSASAGTPSLLQELSYLSAAVAYALH